ncbi:MAG: Dabb family protein [Bacteroidota bacterium]
MYKHLVFWQLKPKAQGRTRLENARLIVEKIKGLKSSIPEIQFLDVGLNVGAYKAAFSDVGMYITFLNEQDFLAYTKYESHDEVVAFIQSVMEEEIIVDFINNTPTVR